MVAPCANELYILRYAYFDITGQFLNALSQFYHKITTSLFVCCLMLFCIASCKKDIAEPIQQTQSSTGVNGNSGITFRDGEGISVSEARQWFTNNYGIKKHVEVTADTGPGYDIAPVWAFADEGTFGISSLPIVVALMEPIKVFPFESNNWSSHYLLFYKDDTGNLQCGIMLYVDIRDPATETYPVDIAHFLGLIIRFDLNGHPYQKVSWMDNGEWIVDFDITDENPPISAMASFSWDAFWDYFNFIMNQGSGAGSGAFNPNTFPPNNSSNTSSGGGGSTNSSSNNNTFGGGLLLHDIYMNPLIKIEEYLNNVLGEYPDVFEVFGFLNSDERQFLANYLPFIDLAYDYLTLHNHSAQARQVIKDAIYLFLHYPVPNFQAGLEVADLYQEMTTNGQTNLGLDEFWELYNLVVNELKPQLGLNQGEVNWLLSQHDVAWGINDFLDTYGNNADSDEYANYMIDIMSISTEVDLNGLVDAYEWKLLLDNPASAPAEEDVQEIQNGIDILASWIPTDPPISSYIGGVPPRGNLEDLTFGTNANTEGIDEDMVALSNAGDDDGLFNEMTDLFHLATTFDLDLRTVGDNFIYLFKINVAVSDYHHPTLSEHVKNTNVMKNFIKRFGARLNDELQVNGGDINSILEIQMPLLERPIFNSTWHKVTGYTILINDTEQTTVNQMTNFQINQSTGDWSGSFFFEITDHFGLDRADALKYQGINDGFAAWWLLQHDRGFIPEKTKIWVVATIKGKINP